MADEGGDDAVKVAVRVRPFNATDGENPKCIVHMDGQTTTITDPATGVKKDFSFDFCCTHTLPVFTISLHTLRRFPI